MTGLAMVEATLPVPRNSKRAPAPAQTIIPSVPPGRTNRPTRNTAAPTSTVTVPTTRRCELSDSNPSSGRNAAIGGIRAARQAGMITAASVTPTPTAKAMPIVRGWSTRGMSGKPAPAALKIDEQQLGDAHARGDAGDGGDDRHDEGFDDDQQSHPPAARADGPQQRQLAKALADGDGEHVVDEEGTHEHRDDGERQEADAERADERVDRVHRLVVERGLRHHLDGVGQSVLQGPPYLAHVEAVGDLELDAVVLAFRAEDRRRRLGVDGHDFRCRTQKHCQGTGKKERRSQHGQALPHYLHSVGVFSHFPVPFPYDARKGKRFIHNQKVRLQPKYVSNPRLSNALGDR